MNRFLVLTAVLTVFCGMAGWSSADVLETWESATRQTSFDGHADCTWVGDIGVFAIQAGDWPTTGSYNFGDSTTNAIESWDVPADGLYTVLTDVSAEIAPNQAAEWSVFASGNSVSIQSSYWFQVVLLSNTSDVAAVDSPDASFAGYRLSVAYDGGLEADALTLWKCAAGDGDWTALNKVSLGSANVANGWNLLVSRSADGQWTVSHANGEMGTTPVFDFNANDTSVDLDEAAWYAGMSYRTRNHETYEKAFGFDNFQVIPEPMTLSLLAVGGLVMLRRKR